MLQKTMESQKILLKLPFDKSAINKLENDRTIKQVRFIFLGKSKSKTSRENLAQSKLSLIWVTKHVKVFTN